MIKSKLEVERLETIRKVIPDRYNVARNEGNGSSKSNAQETVKISRVEGYECLSRKRVKGLKIRCGTLFFMRQSNKVFFIVGCRHVFVLFRPRPPFSMPIFDPFFLP
jgi:hypothetical protein